jgi:predicted kinase
MEAVLFTGIQASGKTTFFTERLAATHAHLSLDVAGTRENERRLLAACIAARRPFAVDNTNLTAADRARYIAAARSAGYRVTGYFFETELKAAIARNQKRSDGKKVPVPALLRAYKRLERPSLAEGFDRLFLVRLEWKNGSVVTHVRQEPG